MVVEFNGRPVQDNVALVAMVVATKPGTTCRSRSSATSSAQTLNVTIDELDLDAESWTHGVAAAKTDEPSRKHTGFGMTVDADHAGHCARARAAAQPRRRGRRQRRAQQPGRNAGVARGDVILEVNRQAVSNLSQVTSALQSAQAGQPVFLVVWRDGAEIFVRAARSG